MIKIVTAIVGSLFLLCVIVVILSIKDSLEFDSLCAESSGVSITLHGNRKVCLDPKAVISVHPERSLPPRQPDTGPQEQS